MLQACGKVYFTMLCKQKPYKGRKWSSERVGGAEVGPLQGPMSRQESQGQALPFRTEGPEWSCGQTEEPTKGKIPIAGELREHQSYKKSWREKRALMLLELLFCAKLNSSPSLNLWGPQWGGFGSNTDERLAFRITCGLPSWKPTGLEWVTVPSSPTVCSFPGCQTGRAGRVERMPCVLALVAVEGSQERPGWKECQRGQGRAALLCSWAWWSHTKKKKKKVSINFSNHFLPKIQLIFKIKP